MDDDYFWYEYDKLNAELTEMTDEFNREWKRIYEEYEEAKKALLEGV